MRVFAQRLPGSKMQPAHTAIVLPHQLDSTALPRVSVVRPGRQDRLGTQLIRGQRLTLPCREIRIGMGSRRRVQGQAQGTRQVRTQRNDGSGVGKCAGLVGVSQ